MSNRYGTQTLPSPSALHLFPRIGEATENDISHESGPAKPDRPTKAIEIKSIPLKNIDELLKAQEETVTLFTRKTKVLKHMHYASMGLSITLFVASVLVITHKYWALFLLIPIGLGFLEMLITMMIANKDNEL